jgi:hypothetical protein
MKLRFGQMRDELALFLAQWPFEWFASMSFAIPAEQEIARKRLIEWTRKLCVKEGVQVAFIAVFNKAIRSHLHVLMLARSKSGKTLSNISMSTWSRQWGHNTNIDSIYNLHGVGVYLSYKNVAFENADKWEFFIYNKNLLERSKIKPVCKDRGLS